MVHYNCEPARGNFRQLASLEKTLEQQDPSRVMTFAQRYCGLDLDQRETVGFAQRGQHPPQAVPIRIGLDDGEHLRTGGALAGFGEIRAQRRKIDLRDKRTGHGSGGDSRLERDPARAGLVWGDKTWYKARAACAGDTYYYTYTRSERPRRSAAGPSSPGAHGTVSRTMQAGFYTIMAAQFFSSLADNALLVAAIQLLRD